METRSQSFQIQLKVDLRTITLGVPPQEVNDICYPQYLQYLNYTVMYKTTAFATVKFKCCRF